MFSLITTPIGNLGEVSPRVVEAICSADLFLCEDTRVTKKLLSLLASKYDLNVNSDRFVPVHSHNENEFISTLSPSFFDENIAYLSDAGTPCVSDPACHIVNYCIENKIDIDLVGLNSSLLYAYALSGFCERSFLFYGFLPHSKGRDSSLSKIMNSEYLTIVFEAPHRLLKLIKEIVNIDPDRELFLAKELSKKYQKIYRNSAKSIYDQLTSENIRGEWVVLVKPKEISANKILVLDEVAIMKLDIDIKSKSKLLSKILKISPKECYSRLLNKDNQC